MSNDHMEKKIHDALIATMPEENFDIILHACEEIDKKRKNEGKSMNKNLFTWPKLALAFSLTVALVLGGMYAFNTPVQALTIMLDVNPSISLEVEDGKVVAIVAENEDAQSILGDLQLNGLTPSEAVKTLVESMIANGYISELQNTLLLSVDGDDEDEIAALLTQEVQTLLTDAAIEGAVIYQDIDFEDGEFDDDLEELATANAISVGKAALIQRLIEIDSTLVFEELATLTVNQLGLLLETKAETLPGELQQQGTSNNGSYLTKEEVLAQALSYFGLDASMVTEYEIEFDVEDGIFTYEVEIKTAQGDYEIDVNAVTGAILETDVDTNDDNDDDSDDDNDDDSDDDNDDSDDDNDDLDDDNDDLDDDNDDLDDDNDDSDDDNDDSDDDNDDLDDDQDDWSDDNDDSDDDNDDSDDDNDDSDDDNDDSDDDNDDSDDDNDDSDDDDND